MANSGCNPNEESEYKDVKADISNKLEELRIKYRQHGLPEAELQRIIHKYDTKDLSSSCMKKIATDGPQKARRA